MSEDVTKTVLRLRLFDASDEYDYIRDTGYRHFKDVLEENGIEVEDCLVEEDDGLIEYIDQVREYRAIQLGDNFYVDLILDEDGDYTPYVYPVKKLAKLAKKFAKLFNKDYKEVRLVSYTYYNGADEPEVY